MRSIESVISVLHQFSALTNNEFGTLVVPFTDVGRSDNPDSIREEMTSLGTAQRTKENPFTQSKLEVGTTTNPVPHTPLNVEKDKFIELWNRYWPDLGTNSRASELLGQYAKIPLHLVTWWFRMSHDHISSPVVVPSVREFGSEAVADFLAKLEENTTRSVRVIDALLADSQPSALGLPLSERVRIYGVIGHSSRDQREAGLNRSSQSNENGHLHVVALPDNILQESVENNRSVSPSSRLAHIGVFDHVFSQCLTGLVTQNQQKRRVTQTDPTESYKQDETTKRISFLNGYLLHFDQPVSFAEAMKVVLETVEKYQKIYDCLLAGYEAHHTGAHKPGFQEKNKQALIKTLEEFSVNKNEAQQLIEVAFSLIPTYGQVRKWQNAMSADDPDREKFTSLLQKFSRQRELLQGSKPLVLAQLSKLYHLSEIEAEELFALIEDRLKEPVVDEKRINTMPGELSGSYSFDYSLRDDGTLKVKSIVFATRFSGASIFTDLVGYVLKRERR